MPLTNSQYAAIKREYDEINTANEKIANERLREVENLSPEFAANRKAINDISAQVALSIINSGDEDRESYKKRIDGLVKRQAEILKSLGKPDDYLDPIYKCDKCHDTGVVNGRRCTCFQKRAIELIYNDSNLRNITAGTDLSSFDLSIYSNDKKDASGKTPYMYASEALKVAKDFVGDFDKKHDNIFIYGHTGVGKTFLSSCIAGELINTTHSVVYITALEFFERFEDRDEYSPILECDLLIIDDLGTELSNTFTNSKLFYCINERLLRNKSTIISTNLSLGEIESVYTERISSRILSSYSILRLTGDDIRTKKLFS